MRVALNGSPKAIEFVRSMAEALVEACVGELPNTPADSFSEVRRNMIQMARATHAHLLKNLELLRRDVTVNALAMRASAGQDEGDAMAAQSTRLLSELTTILTEWNLHGRATSRAMLEFLRHAERESWHNKQVVWDAAAGTCIERERASQSPSHLHTVACDTAG